MSRVVALTGVPRAAARVPVVRPPGRRRPEVEPAGVGPVGQDATAGRGVDQTGEDVGAELGQESARPAAAGPSARRPGRAARPPARGLPPPSRRSGPAARRQTAGTVKSPRRVARRAAPDAGPPRVGHHPAVDRPGPPRTPGSPRAVARRHRVQPGPRARPGPPLRRPPAGSTPMTRAPAATRPAALRRPTAPRPTTRAVRPRRSSSIG